MDNGTVYCYSCFGQYDAALHSKCPLCGESRRDNERGHLTAGTMLGGRYLVGLVTEQDGNGVSYAGYDPALDLPVRIREYFPSDTATRAHTLSAFVLPAPGRAEAFGDGLDAFAEMARELAHSAPAGVGQLRDFLALGGTEYMITTGEPLLPERQGDTRPFTPITPAAPPAPVAAPPLKYPVGEPVKPVRAAETAIKELLAKKPAPQKPDGAAKKPATASPWRVVSAILALLLVASVLFALLRDPESIAVAAAESKAISDMEDMKSQLESARAERDAALDSLSATEDRLDSVSAALSTLQESYPEAWVILNAMYNADADLKLISTELKASQMRYLTFDFEVYAESYAAFTGQSFTISVYRPDGTLWQGDGSPEGATGSFEFGIDDTVYTWGWGNPEQSDYVSGDYTIVFMHNSEIIGGFIASVD